MMNFWLEVLKLLIPAVISIVVIYIGRYLERKKEIEQELRKQKIQVYKDFLNFLFRDVLGSVKQDKQLDLKKAEKFMMEFVNNLIFWGSDEVINEYNKYFQGLKSGKFNMIQLERLLLSIRKDTGHNNRKLKEYDILGIFINDIEELNKLKEIPVNIDNSGENINGCT